MCESVHGFVEDGCLMCATMCVCVHVYVLVYVRVYVRVCVENRVHHLEVVVEGYLLALGQKRLICVGKGPPGLHKGSRGVALQPGDCLALCMK